MRYVLGTMGARTGTQARLDVFAGTSAGGLNTCFLAASAEDPAASGRRLAEYWIDLAADRVFRFGTRDLLRSGELLAGGRWGMGGGLELRGLMRSKAAPHPPVAGIFDTRPLWNEMRQSIPWAGLRRNLADGTVRGVALCATEVCTGRATVFHEMTPGQTFPSPKDPFRKARRVTVSVDHAMASAAIPFVFPSVQLDGVCFVDGALFLNTPLIPAIRLGANRLLVVSLSRAPADRHAEGRLSCRRNPYPGASFLLGRLLASMTDRQLDYEIERMEMFNRLIRAGGNIRGAAFLEELDEAAIEFRNAPYRFIETVHIRPSRDLNDIALETLGGAPGELRFAGSAGRVLRRIMLSRPMLESELTSFLAFCPPFARALIELGHADAEARQDELVDLFRR
jgi:NTE family protein